MTRVFVSKIPEISQRTFDRLLQKVSKERQEKVDRLKLYDKKCQSLAVELLLRKVLVSYFNINESDIVIEKTPEGKPFLKGDRGLFISLSHCDGLVAVAVSDCEVGVDAECVRNIDSKIAKRFFTESEQEYVFKTDDATTDRFFEVWTRKEAMAKKRGVGLSADMSFCTVKYFDRFKTFTMDGYTVTVCTDSEYTNDVSFVLANDLLEEYIV